MVIRLTKSQIFRIRQRIRREGVTTPELAGDLLDHFSVAIEQEMGQGHSFKYAYEHVFDTLQQDELKNTEMKTQELLEGKKIFYPNLLQSFGLVLIAYIFGWLGLKVIQAIAIGIEDMAMREQWLEQNSLVNFEIINILVWGVPIGYTIWKKKRTQATTTIFAFRPVPAYVYGIVLLVGAFSWLWLEPLALFFPLFQENREHQRLLLEDVDPLVVMLISVGNMLLVELLARGIILRGLLMTMTPLKAILWSSLCCSLLIYPHFATVFSVSLMLGWIYWKTRSLYPAVFMLTAIPVLHYTIAQYMGSPKEFFLQFTWWNYIDHNLMIYLSLVGGSLLLTAGLLYYLDRRLNGESSKQLV